MTRFLLIILMHIPLLSFGQSLEINEDSVMKKWIPAIINIEGRSTLWEQLEIRDSVLNLYKNKIIDTPTYKHVADSFVNQKISWTGTGIYFFYNDRHYLLTARHVLADPLSNSPNDISKSLRIIDNGSDTNRRSSMESVMFGLQFFNSAVFSATNLDLAVLCFNQFPGGIQMIEQLNKRGYIPVTLNDIDTSNNLSINDKIYAFGYPDFAKVGIKKVESEFLESKNISLPLVSKGSISEVKKDNYWFFGNIYVSQGNSGGAIVRNNKLIGIVSRAERELKSNGNSKLDKYIFINMLFIKANYLMPLIRLMASLKEQLH